MEKGEVYIVTNKDGQKVELEAVDVKIKIKSGPKWKSKEPKK